MTHRVFEPHFDHDFIAAQIEADIAADTAGGTVVTGPRAAQPPASDSDPASS